MNSSPKAQEERTLLCFTAVVQINTKRKEDQFANGLLSLYHISVNRSGCCTFSAAPPILAFFKLSLHIVSLTGNIGNILMKGRVFVLPLLSNLPALEGYCPPSLEP